MISAAERFVFDLVCYFGDKPATCGQGWIYYYRSNYANAPRALTLRGGQKTNIHLFVWNACGYTDSLNPLACGLGCETVKS